MLANIKIKNEIQKMYLHENIQKLVFKAINNIQKLVFSIQKLVFRMLLLFVTSYLTICYSRFFKS